MFNFAIRETPWGASLTADMSAPSSRRLDSLCLPDGEVIRPFDIHREDRGRLIELKEEVYDRPVDRSVFEWQYFRHPRSSEIRVFVVEHERRIVAATTRFPATLRLGGADHPCFFNIDSMVHPEQRRRGRMRDLYLFARTHLPPGSIGLSKGSSANIYPLLLSIGHREILPNNYLVNYPSATRWLMSRLHLRSPSSRPPGSPGGLVVSRAPAGFEDFQPVERFGPELDAYFERVSPKFPGLLVRDAAYMNWRYADIPHRRYFAFRRVERGEVVSFVIVGVNGDQGHFVDLLWDPERDDSPERCVRLAKAVFEEHHAVRVICFATHPRLRDALLRTGFVERGESPRFSAHIPPSAEAAFAAAHELHVVDGDGDTEFS